MLKKNDVITLDIDSLTSAGSGIGRYGESGMCVFVGGAAPGDRLRVRIIKVKKNYAVGRIESVDLPSPCRVEPDCPAAAKCGGCSFRHISYEAELEYKRGTVKDAFSRIGHIDADVPPVISAGGRQRYRNKAQYPVRLVDGQIRVGFFAPMSHRVIDVGDCLLEPEEFGRINDSVRAWMKNCGITAYDEASGSGFLRHIYLRKAFATGEVMVCAVVNSRKMKRAEEFVSAVRGACPDIASVCADYNTADTNVVLGESYDVLYGADGITDVLCGIKVKISPLSFYQVNHAAAELLYEKALRFAAPGPEDTVCDLYCGAGTIGLSMARSAGKVIGVEIVPEAVEDARENARLNGIKNAEFICADAASAAAELEKRGERPAVVIVDPPRKGCSGELLAVINRMSPDRLVYVSCDPATLARDCAVLYGMGWEVKAVQPYDLFPGTTHVETVVLMTKK